MCNLDLSLLIIACNLPRSPGCCCCCLRRAAILRAANAAPTKPAAPKPIAFLWLDKNPLLLLLFITAGLPLVPKEWVEVVEDLVSWLLPLVVPKEWVELVEDLVSWFLISCKISRSIFRYSLLWKKWYKRN